MRIDFLPKREERGQAMSYLESLALSWNAEPMQSHLVYGSVFLVGEKSFACNVPVLGPMVRHVDVNRLSLDCRSVLERSPRLDFYRGSHDAVDLAHPHILKRRE